MTSFFAIVKLTYKSAIRSHIFQILLAILIFTIIALPLTVTGDGTARAHIQVSLQYCLGAISFLLSLSTIWIGCYTMGNDIDSYQLHMVITKPISRVKIWLAKCTGIIVLHGLLLFISSILIYGLILWQFNKRSFSDIEKKRINDEVLVGRRVFMPKPPVLAPLAEKIYKQELERSKANNKKLSPPEQIKLRNNIYKRVFSSEGELQAGYTKQWQYQNLNKNDKSPLYLRYRTYVDKIDTKDQRETLGIWSALINIPAPSKSKNNLQKEKIMQQVYSPRTNYPEKIMCGTFNEIVMSPMIINEDGEATVAFSNYDPQGKALFFQPSDGPKLLIKATGFFGNYLRGIFMIFLKISFLAALSCAVGGIISIPVAIFSVIAYLLFGAFSYYLIGIDQKLTGGGESASSGELLDIIGNFVSKILSFLIISMDKFEISYLLADGELIELSYIFKVILFNMLPKGAILLLLGVWLYRRREMGLVIRK